MTLAYNNNDIKIYNDDFFKFVENIEDNSVDLIFADPPYFLSNGGITCKSGKMESVDKGNWDKAENLKSIHEFNRQWLELCKRKLKKDGSIFVSGTMHNIYSIGFALQELDYKIINDIAWFKVNPPPNLSCKYLTHSTETILWAKKSADSKHTFNYQVSKEINFDNVGKQMLSLWKIMPPKKEEKKHGKHPTQKPLALLDRIIKIASNKNDLVLDPFCGSGTTALACLLNNRHFIGTELDEQYINLAIKRLSDY